MAHNQIFNTHYNVLDALILANAALVSQVASMVHPQYDLLNSSDASQHFDAWWIDNEFHWHPSDRSAIYTIWEAVWWAKTQLMDGGSRTWWDAISALLEDTNATH